MALGDKLRSKLSNLTRRIRQKSVHMQMRLSKDETYINMEYYHDMVEDIMAASYHARVDPLVEKVKAISEDDIVPILEDTDLK